MDTCPATDEAATTFLPRAAMDAIPRCRGSWRSAAMRRASGQQHGCGTRCHMQALQLSIILHTGISVAIRHRPQALRRWRRSDDDSPCAPTVIRQRLKPRSRRCPMIRYGALHQHVAGGLLRGRDARTRTRPIFHICQHRCQRPHDREQTNRREQLQPPQVMVVSPCHVLPVDDRRAVVSRPNNDLLPSRPCCPLYR